MRKSNGERGSAGEATNDPLSAVLSTVDKRHRRTKAAIAAMRETMFAFLERDRPQSGWHLFYQMTDSRLDCAVEKSECGYRRVQYHRSAVLIDRDIEAKLREHLSGHNEISSDRLPTTADQAAEYDLPTKPRDESDRRVRHIERTVEVEAMPAHILRQLLRDKLDAFLPRRAPVIARAAEESERAGSLALADAMEAR
jgi:hypothetical protein